MIDLCVLFFRKQFFLHCPPQSVIYWLLLLMKCDERRWSSCKRVTISLPLAVTYLRHPSGWVTELYVNTLLHERHTSWLTCSERVHKACKLISYTSEYVAVAFSLPWLSPFTTCCLHSPVFLLLSPLTLGAHTVWVWYARGNLSQQFTRLCCLPQPSKFVFLSADSKAHESCQRKCFDCPLVFFLGLQIRLCGASLMKNLWRT